MLPFVPLAGPGSTVAELLASWFRFQCHGLAERTVALGGRPFPVCSRCLGVYLGLALAAAVARPTIAAPARRIWIVVAAAAMVAEVSIQDLTEHPPIHWLRAATGIALAWPIALTLLATPAARGEAQSSSSSSAGSSSDGSTPAS